MAAPRFNKIDPTSIIAKDEVSQEYGMLVRLAHGPNKDPVRFQTPLARLAWAPTPRDKYNPSQPSCVLSLSLDPAVQDFKDWLNDVDSQIIKLVAANSKEWLGKTLDESFISGVYMPVVKQAKESKWADTFCPRLPLKKDLDSGNWTVAVKTFRANKEPGNPSELLTKNAECVAVVQISYVFVNRGNKSVTVRCDVDQVCAIPAPQEDEFQIDISTEPRMLAAAEEANKRSFDAIGSEVELAPEGPEDKRAKLDYEADGDDV